MTRNQQKLDKISMVLYNNVLSLPLLLVVAGINGEYTSLLQVRSRQYPTIHLDDVSSSVTRWIALDTHFMWLASSQPLKPRSMYLLTYPAFAIKA